MSTYHFLLVLVALALLVLGAVTVVSVFDVATVTSSTELSRFDSVPPATLVEARKGHATRTAPVDSGQSSESTPQPCAFVETKGPNGIRGIACAILSSIGDH